MGDNLLKKSEKCDECDTEKIHCDTVYEVLDKSCHALARPVCPPMRVRMSDIYKINGVGDVWADCIAQRQVKPGGEVVFLPMQAVSNLYARKASAAEMHHQREDLAILSDNVGLNILGLDRHKMPRSGDFVVHNRDTTSSLQAFDVA